MSLPEPQWQPMSTAPRDGRYIAVKPKRSAPAILCWNADGEPGWWLPEGALYQDDDLSGWAPIPRGSS